MNNDQYEQLIKVLRTVFNDVLEHKKDYRHVILGNLNDEVTVPNREDYSYVRENLYSSTVYQVFNKRVSGVAGLPVLVGELSWQPGLIQVIAVDWEAYARTEWGGGYSAIKEHAVSHMYPTESDIGIDPVLIYQPAIQTFKAIPNTGLTITISSGQYYHDNVLTFFEGDYLDLTSFVPTETNSKREVLVYLDTLDNTIKTEAEVAIPDYDDEVCPRPKLPINAIPICYVKLNTGLTEITFTEIIDARNLFGVPLDDALVGLSYQWTYADATDRENSGDFITSDIGKLARQLDNNSLWMLTATTPEWVLIGQTYLNQWQVAFAGSDGSLTGNDNFLWDNINKELQLGNDLILNSVTGSVSATALIGNTFDITSIPFVGDLQELKTSANLQWDGSQILVNGSPIGNTELPTTRIAFGDENNEISSDENLTWATGTSTLSAKNIVTDVIDLPNNTGIIKFGEDNGIFVNADKDTMFIYSEKGYPDHTVLITLSSITGTTSEISMYSEKVSISGDIYNEAIQGNMGITPKNGFVLVTGLDDKITADENLFWRGEASTPKLEIRGNLTLTGDVFVDDVKIVSATGVSQTLTDQQIAFGSVDNSITSSNNLTWNQTGTTLTIQGQNITDFKLSKLVMGLQPEDNSPAVSIESYTYITGSLTSNSLVIKVDDFYPSASSSNITIDNYTIELDSSDVKITKFNEDNNTIVFMGNGGLVKTDSGLTWDSNNRQVLIDGSPIGGNVTGTVSIPATLVPFGNASNLITTDNKLNYITGTSTLNSENLALSSLTENSLLIAGANGLITEDSALTWDSVNEQILINGVPVGGATGSSVTLTNKYVGFGSNNNLITGTSEFTWDNDTKILTIGTPRTFGYNYGLDVRGSVDSVIWNIFENTNVGTSNTVVLGTIAKDAMMYLGTNSDNYTGANNIFGNAGDSGIYVSGGDLNIQNLDKTINLRIGGTDLTPILSIASGTTTIGEGSRLLGTLQGFIDIDRCGFLNQTETAMYFDNVSTLTLTGSTWSYYRNGIKYTVTGNKSIELANPMVDGTMYYVYIDSTNGDLSVSTNSWTLEDSKIPVTTIYWDSGLTPKYLMAEERHTCLVDRRFHLDEHLTGGTKIATASILTGPTIGSSINSEKTVGITASKIFDEDIYLTTNSVTKGDGVNPAYYILYRTSSDTWKWYKSIMPFKYTTTGAIEYDNNGTMTPAGTGGGANTRYVNYYLFVSNVLGELSVCFIPGRSAFTSATLAYAETFSSFSLVGLPIAEGVAIYQFTWDTNGSNLGLCRLTRTPVRINQPIASTTAVIASSHNLLPGLQGGITGSYYHLTDTEYTEFQNIDNNYFLLDQSTPQTVTGTPIFPSLNINNNSYFGDNVGIGTTNPQYGNLEVKPILGDNNTGITLYAGTGTTARNWLASNGDWSFTRSATYGISIDSAGKVGIGAANPSVALDVTGDITTSTGKIYLENKDASGLRINTVTSPDRYIGFLDAKAAAMTLHGNIGIDSSYATALTNLATLGGNSLSVKNNGYFGGNVGIGLLTPVWSVSSPSQILEITYDGDGFPVLNLSRVNGSTKTNAQWSMYLSSLGDFVLRDVTNSRSLLTLKNDGKVGVAQTAPSAQLEVKTIDTTVPTLKLTTLTSQTANLMRWTTGGIDVNGNMGIGITSPESLLDVRGSGVDAATQPIITLSTPDNQTITSGSELGKIQFSADDSSTGAVRCIGAEISYKANENWNGTSHGGYLSFGVRDTVANFKSDIFNIVTGGGVGKIGIGTTTPTVAMDLEFTTDGFDGLDIVNLSNGISAGNRIVLYSNTGTISIGKLGSNATAWTGYGDARDSFIYSSNTGGGKLNIINAYSAGGIINFYSKGSATTNNPDFQINGEDVYKFVKDVPITDAFILMTNASSTAKLFIPKLHMKGVTSISGVVNQIIADISAETSSDTGAMLNFSARVNNATGCSYRPLFTFNNYTTELVRITPNEFVVNESGLSYYDFRVESDSYNNALFVDASANSVTIMGNSAGKIGFFGASPVVKATALTTALSNVTYTAPGSPDYAWGTGTNSNAWGFTNVNEFETMASVIKNLQDRVNGLETKLKDYGLLT